MTPFRDMFNNAFCGKSNDVGEDGKATNLTETNRCIARQSNLVDEIIAQKQRARHSNFFPFNSAEKPDPALSDDFVMDLTRKIDSLGLMERQEAQNDIYGFGARPQKEEPWQLNNWMQEMDEIIRRRVSGNDKQCSALRLAMHTNNSSGNNGFLTTNMSGSEYIKSQKLKFLRASNWNVKDAVSRMALNFELRLEYFGSELLVRDLTIKDLNPTDLDLWKRHGFLQLSEDRDAYGRPIIVFFRKEQFHLPLPSVIRCILYLSTVLTRDESIQMAGFVGIFWSHGQEFAALRRAKLVLTAFNAAPMRCVAAHLCYENPGTRDLLGTIAQTLEAWATLRLKLHNGTTVECFYNLMTYGISRNFIPVNNQGEVELDFHVSFIEAIERKEADEEKLRRRERLDRQIQQMQLQNLMPYNNQIENNSQHNPMISGGRGEPYQRNPPAMPIEERNEADRSALLSWNMSGLSGMEPFSLRTEDGESLPDDLLRKLASITSSTTVGGSDPFHFSSQTSKQNIESNKMSMTTSVQLQQPANLPSDPTQRDDSQKDDFILVPGVYDVIMGRGRHNKKKPGNRKLNALLESYQAEYEASDKFQKTVLSEVVVSKMIEDGSRFLVREGEKEHGIWVEVSLEKARDKVAHDFRNMRRTAKIAKQSTLIPSIDAMNIGGKPKRQRSMGHTIEGESDLKARKSTDV